MENDHKTGIDNQQMAQEFAIDRLLAEFHQSVGEVVSVPEKQGEMVTLLKQFNPKYVPLGEVGELDEKEVLVNVVAGVYAPLIHGFSSCVAKNIKEGLLPPVVLAPPRDAIPIAVSLQEQSRIQGVDVQLLMPHVNRNTAGIANNQKAELVDRSPFLDTHFDQLIHGMNGKKSAVELETGIYGTTSLVMAEGFKERGLEEYVPIKIYGLGPNLSFVHAILSNGQEWVAEVAEEGGLVDLELARAFMVILDTMEELGMEKFYQSVEDLGVDDNGKVIPVIVPASEKELSIAQATNQVIKDSALKYTGLSPSYMLEMVKKVPWLTKQSTNGFPFTLTSPIPSMDSKKEHYNKVRNSGLFNYPKLII